MLFATMCILSSQKAYSSLKQSACAVTVKYSFVRMGFEGMHCHYTVIAIFKIKIKSMF